MKRETRCNAMLAKCMKMRVHEQRTKRANFNFSGSAKRKLLLVCELVAG